MIGTLLAVLRLEALSLMRTREATLFALLPAGLFPPLMLVGTILGASLWTEDGTVAVPLDDPPGLGLGAALDDEWTVLRATDPSAEVVAGRADVAVTRWARGAPGEAWVEVDLAGDAALTPSLERALRSAVDAEIDRRLEAAGGRPVVDRRIADVRVAPRPGGDPVLPRVARSLPYWLAFLACYLGCMLVPVRTASERLTGGLEALAVTASGVWPVFAARALVGSAFVVAVVSLPVLSLGLVFGPFVPELPPLDLAALAEAAALVLLFHVGFVACGLLASSTRTALYMASYLVLLAPTVVVVRFVWRPLPWVPLAGATEQDDPHAVWFRALATLALALAALVALARMGRHERVLPGGTVSE